jgi:hemolysin D
MIARAELEFLPAALELQETPPMPQARWIVWGIMLFFTVSVLWAVVGRVDVVSVAHGKIVPSGRVKIIQPLETGVVRRIHVGDGQRVAAGQTLIELDTTLSGAEREQVLEQQLGLKLDRARLKALLALARSAAPGASGVLKDTHLDAAGLTSLVPVHSTPDQMETAKQRVLTQWQEFHALGTALEEERRQKEAERRAAADRIARLDAVIPLVTERAQSLAGLLERDLVPRVQWLELEQQRIEQVKERDVQQSTLAMLDAGIANLRQREAAAQAEFRSRLLGELAETENRLAAFDQELVKTEQRIGLLTLAAPVAGTVHRLAVHTVGGVVTPAQELMHIVPDGDAVEVEAWVPNRDIGFVHEGQPVGIKVETFPFTMYGTVDGTLINVSGDATPDERLGLVYAARVRLDRSTMRVDERVVSLTPGMAVTAEVKLSDRRIIEYLLSPLLRYRDESIRER